MHQGKLLPQKISSLCQQLVLSPGMTDLGSCFRCISWIFKNSHLGGLVTKTTYPGWKDLHNCMNSFYYFVSELVICRVSVWHGIMATRYHLLKNGILGVETFRTPLSPHTHSTGTQASCHALHVTSNIAFFLSHSVQGENTSHLYYNIEYSETLVFQIYALFI